MPILPVDYSDDYLYADGVESLTYTPPTGATSSCHGVRTTVTKPTGDGGGGYAPEPSSVTWYVWAFGTTPTVGGTLTDPASVVWVIYDVSQRSDESQWGLACQRKV